MLLVIFLFFIFMVVYVSSPIYARIIIFIVNIFVPDPIPFVDEIIMFALLFK